MLLYMADTLPILTGRYSMINELKLRARKRGEVLPGTQLATESWYDFRKRLGAVHVKVRGQIGRTGTKVHDISAEYIKIGDDNVVISAYSFCGSQRFGSGLALILTDEPVTCLKCTGKGGTK